MTTLEKAAMALWERAGKYDYPDNDRPPFEACKPYWEAQAKAALLAVRSHDIPSWAHFEQEAWRDGIDDLLGEEA